MGPGPHAPWVRPCTCLCIVHDRCITYIEYDEVDYNGLKTTYSVPISIMGLIFEIRNASFALLGAYDFEIGVANLTEIMSLSRCRRSSECELL